MADRDPHLNELPHGWSRPHLCELCDPSRPIVYGIVQAGPHLSDGVPYIRSTDLTTRLDPRRLMRTSKDIAHKYRRSRLTAGDLVLSLRGNIGAVLPVPASLSGANLTQGTARIAVIGDHDSVFVKHALKSRQARAYFYAVAKGSALREISLHDLRQLRLLMPPLVEQEGLGRVLDTWDAAANHARQLIRARRKLKRGLLQQLLAGERRFPEFRNEPLRGCRLRDVAALCNEAGRGSLGRDRVMGVTKNRGIVPMEDRLIGDVDRYQIVRRNWFAYNPMRLNIGSIGRYHDRTPALVSPDYVVFRCLEGELDPGYLDHFRRSHEWASFMNACGAGSVRIRIYFKDLGRLKIQLPPFQEQQRIAELFDTLDHEIQLLEGLHDALKEQKKGLMQQLLTGNVRVPESMLKEAAHA